MRKQIMCMKDEQNGLISENEKKKTMIITFLRQEWNPVSETKQELDTLLEIIFMVQPSIHLFCIPTIINKIPIQGSYVLAWEIMSQLVNTIIHSHEKGFQAINDSLDILVKGMESLSNII